MPATKKKSAVKKGSETVKKSTKKKSPAKKEGLSKPQVRVLQCLAKAKKPLTRAEISDKGNVDLAMLNSYIGSQNDAIRKKNDQKVMPSLLTLKLVRQVLPEEGQGASYEITTVGAKALKATKDSG